MSDGERILVMAHGHPDLIRGGGEIAAHQSFRTYAAHPGVEKAWFLGAAPGERGATGRIRTHRPGEYLWEQGLSDPFRMTAANLHEVTGYFAELIRALRPTVIHSHHYFKLGLEYLKVVKDIDPSIRLVLTLHEYMAICPNSGLMINPASGDLCTHGAWDRHLGCAPDRTAEDLWLRHHRFRSYFAYVDHFVAPSDFLRERYIEWGIAPDRITTIRNGQPVRDVLPPRPLGTDGQRNRFAFFGQINAQKGLDVLLGALNALGERRRGMVLELHGANMEYQPKAFQDRIRKLAAPLLEEGALVWMGSYAPEELPERMAGIDWVCVPSLWYENAPLVIQEAFGLGRPVLVSGIGGMKEAVNDGQDGLCLPRGNAPAWGAAMYDLAQDPDRWNQLRAGLPRPVSLDDSIAAHLSIFAALAPVPA